MRFYRFQSRCKDRQICSFIHTMFPDMEGPGRDRYHALIREYGLINKRCKGKSTINSTTPFASTNSLQKEWYQETPMSFGAGHHLYCLQRNDRCHLHLTTDVYSRKIVGWCLSTTRHALYTLSALKMAVDSCPGGRLYSPDTPLRQRYIVLL